MQRAILLLLAAVIAAPAQTLTLTEAIDQAIAGAPGLRGPIGVHVVDLATGATLYERNGRMPMTPASNMKLLTTALALDRLGADYRFKTRVLAPALPSPAGGVASLRIAGTGDPSLSGRAYPFENKPGEVDPLAAFEDLADQVVKMGVRRVGTVIGDDSLYPYDSSPEGWTADDLTWEYGAPVSALTVHDNALLLTVTPAKTSPMADVMFRPATEYYTVSNGLRLGPGLPRRIEVTRQAGSRVIRISGTTPPSGGAATVSIAIDDPALYAAETFKRLLEERGVVVRLARAGHRLPGEPYVKPEGAILARRTSPPLIQLLEVINKLSQNLHAELILLETARMKRGEGSRELALEEMAGFLSSFGMESGDADLFDGSGLSRRALVTPETLTRLLARMHNTHGEAFRTLLPAGGEEGTLAARFRGSRDAAEVRAKTGTISHVTALSGYAGDDPARRVAFSIISNHQTSASAEVRALVDTIALEILRRAKQ
ncbi:MAG TPA: D-alanyl-D-alanine carboxypeptidase/D-alanyl-D-alanine-endopeptidase [Bryobacteraceae bacterium]|nr:D-alanyl-D-alanine carboxypeptidase/D-alanyl-D-alanine-endopeptidase [Bryobacteraceae bacterium]